MKNFAKSEFGFSWNYPELSADQVKRRQHLMSDPVSQVSPSTIKTSAQLLAAMEGMGIQARNLGRAYRVLRAMLADKDNPVIMLGIAGPLIAGGLRQVLREMVEFGLVDVVVSTGAILYQDTYQARGYRHHRGSPNADDDELRDLYVNRIYDAYVDDIAFSETDSWIGKFADTLERRPYSSREFLDRLAEQIDDPQSLVATCRMHGVPMFSPALNDSSIGIGLSEHHHRAVQSGATPMSIDSIRDNYEIAQIIAKAPVTAAIYIAGGVPKNYINDAVVSAYLFKESVGGHRYALQLSTAVTQDGGLSGSTLDEAKTWWKVDAEARTSMVWVEPTIALPLMISAALQDELHRGRPRYRFTWDGEMLAQLRSQ